MDTITPLQQTDLADVARLFQKIFRQGSASAPAGLAPYFEKIYLNNPWRDEAIPSLVFKTDGRVAGFLGVMPLAMTMKGRAIRAAVGGNFMIDPAAANTFAGTLLLKKFLAGPQDLAFTDTATDQGKKMLEGLGSTAIPLYSLQWLRVLRPLGFAGSIGSRSKALAALAMLSKPVSYLVDNTLACIPGSPFRQKKIELHAEELSAAGLLEAIRKFSARCALAPEYSDASLAWLLANAEEKKEYGPLRKLALFTPDQTLQGWFLYYPNAGGLGQVLQLGATPRTAQAVLAHLFTDARDRGSLALTGRMEPQYISELAAQHCIFMHRNSSVVVHAKDPAIINSLHRGDAFFTRLEGEWWTRLQGDTFKADVLL